MSALSLSRRVALQSLAAVTMFPLQALAAWPQVIVHKDPNCGCCSDWARHLQKNGFAVQVVETSEINRLKTRLGVPSDLASCHTAEVGDYVIEGHVPASAVQRLLTERPKAAGLAVPGMPGGSPGMGGEPEEYEVTLFGPQGRSVFARFRGGKEI